MQILALISDAFGGRGGISKFNRDLLTALCASLEVERVVALPRLLPDPLGMLPAKLEYNVSGVGGKIRFTFAAIRAALRFRRTALIVCGHINLLPIAFMARVFCRAPIVMVVHGVDAWQPNKSGLVNRLVRKIDAFISVSEFTKQRFVAWARPEHARNFVLPNCVDLSQFTPGPKSTELMDRYRLGEKTMLLTVARLSAEERYKGVDEVLDVLPRLSKEIPNLAYLIVGDGTDRARLEQKAAKLGLRERVMFCGRIPHDQLVHHHRLADVFVMPGRGEGFGIVYLEAMACGIPVVASRADASSEIIARVEEGTAVDPKNSEELRSAILEAVRNRGRHVPAKLAEFSREKFVERTNIILKELLPAITTECAKTAVAKAAVS